MIAKAIFVIVWKSWKNYKVHFFHTTKEAWQFINDNKILSYSVYWATEELKHSNSTQSLRDHIEQIVKENPEVLSGWKPSFDSLARTGE